MISQCCYKRMERSSFAPHHFPARVANMSQFAQDNLSFETEILRSSEHFSPGQTGLVGYSIIS